MNDEAIKSRLDVRPFQPFRIVTSSGEGYEVRHSEMAFATRTEMVIASPDRQGVPSRARIVANLQITATSSSTSGCTCATAITGWSGNLTGRPTAALSGSTASPGAMVRL